VSGDNGDETKQKLRLAALLHDIGHYPLAHLGEHAFRWADDVNLTPVGDKDADHSMSLLEVAAKSPKGTAAKHERLGELILTHYDSELRRIIKSADFDPSEIARIINAEEDKKNPFHIQLMSSTLDCDRTDFLLRDSIASGTSFGQVDINYIIANIAWDKKNEQVCFKPKTQNAIEHFIMSRYFSYNITYHKTIMGFELMAKALYFRMMSDPEFPKDEFGGIANSIDEIDWRISGDQEFLANFTDEYFWYYLEKSAEWDYGDELFRSLRQHLLHREPLRPIWEERCVCSLQRDNPTPAFRYVLGGLVDDLQSRTDCKATLKDAKIDVERVVVLAKQIDFEGVSYARPYHEKPADDEALLKLVKIDKEGAAVDLIQDPGSVLNLLSQFQQRIVRVYALVPKDGKEERTLKEVIADRVGKHQ